MINKTDKYNISYSVLNNGLKFISKENISYRQLRLLLKENVQGFISIKNLNTNESNVFRLDKLKTVL